MNAIVPYRRSKLRRGASNVAQYASGGIAVDVRVERIDKRNRTIWYSLKLASRDCDVTGRLVGEGRRSEIDELGSMAVVAGSMSSARFSVTTPRTGPYRTMYLEIASQEMMLRVEAPRPPSPRGSLPVKAGVSLFALGVGISCAAAIPLGISRDATLGAPAHALAGSTARLAYATSGLGLASYVATADDGTVVAADRLPARSGEIAFELPARLATHRVSVTLTNRAPWGTTERSAAFTVARPELAANAVARVLSFAAHRDTTASSDSVLASYLAAADGGTIALVDPAGKVVSRAPLGHVGTTRIPIPPEYQGIPLTAQLTVHRAGTRATASVDVPVAANPLQLAETNADLLAAAPAADITPGEGITPIDSSTSAQSGGLVTIQGHAVAGRPIKLAIAPQPSPIHLDLEDETGTSIAEKTVPANTSHATFQLPPSALKTTYLLSITYERNGGAETVIREIVATPR